MKTFLRWLNRVAILYTVVLVLVFLICNFTGGALTDSESDACFYGLLGLMGLSGVGYILDPSIPPRKQRRRR